MKNNNKCKSGFSLMELIVVIVIIGILIAAVIGLNEQKETAKVSAAEKVIIQISNAVQSWGTNNGNQSYKNITLESLIGNGLPNNFDMTKANPWAGSIKVGVKGNNGNEKNHYKIELSNIPYEYCTSLANIFTNQTIETPSCEEDSGSYKLKVIF